MSGTIAVLWTLYGHVYSGRLEIIGDRLELRTRSRTCSIPFSDIVSAAIERGATVRIHGLPVLRLTLAGGETVGIASLQGIGTLHELTAHVVPAAASTI